MPFVRQRGEAHPRASKPLMSRSESLCSEDCRTVLCCAEPKAPSAPTSQQHLLHHGHVVAQERRCQVKWELHVAHEHMVQENADI